MRQVLQLVDLTHAVLFFITAAFHIWFWVRRGFWVPRYVHVLAIGATVIALALLSTIPDDAPVRSEGVLGYVLAVLICPALVYGAFIVFGGAQASDYRRRK